MISTESSLPWTSLRTPTAHSNSQPVSRIASTRRSAIIHVYEPNIYAGPGSYMVPSSTYNRARSAVLKRSRPAARTRTRGPCSPPASAGWTPHYCRARRLGIRPVRKRQRRQFVSGALTPTARTGIRPPTRLGRRNWSCAKPRAPTHRPVPPTRGEQLASAGSQSMSSRVAWTAAPLRTAAGLHHVLTAPCAASSRLPVRAMAGAAPRARRPRSRPTARRSRRDGRQRSPTAAPIMSPTAYAAL